MGRFNKKKLREISDKALKELYEQKKRVLQSMKGRLSEEFKCEFDEYDYDDIEEEVKKRAWFNGGDE